MSSPVVRAGVVLFAVCGGWVASAEAPKPAAAVPAPSQREAAERLTAMTKYMAALPAFQVKVVGSYDVVQETGQKLEFHETRELTVARPDRLRARHVSSDGAEDVIVFDGRTITVFDGGAGVYAQVPQPGSLDDAIVYFVRDLGMRLPLARLLTTRATDELDRRMQSLVYVERTAAVLPGATHHVAGRADGVDVQLWIADGDRPLPVRVVLTYVEEPGQPQFRAQFVDWQTALPESARQFEFKPPPDARRIPFAVQVVPAKDQAPSTGNTGARP